MKYNTGSLLNFFVLAICGMVLGVSSCTFQFQTRDLPWKTIIWIGVQLKDTFPDLSISWQGRMLSPVFPQGRDRDLYVIPDNLVANIQGQSCPPVFEADGIINCPPMDNLHPGNWEFTVEVRSGDAHIPGSPFTCSIPMRVPHGSVRVIQGGVGRAACITGRGTHSMVFPDRVDRGLITLYTFEEGKENTVNDVSGTSPPLDLRIRNQDGSIRPPDQVTWGQGTLVVDVPAIVSPEGSSGPLAERLMAGNEITLEAWIRPANTTQGGPARIVTLSNGPSDRNFTLGAEAGQYVMRLRTDQTSINGTPSLDTPDGVVTTNLTHVVYVRDSAGEAKIYINGAEVVAGNVPGDFSGWDTTHGFALANEQISLPADGVNRHWLGEYHLVAIYERAITQDEILNNWFAGPIID